MDISQQLPEEITTYLKDSQLQKFSVSDKIVIPMHKVKMRLKHTVTHKYVYQNVPYQTSPSPLTTVVASNTITEIIYLIT